MDLNANDRRQRKRIQNRLNQRAHRDRKASLTSDRESKLRQGQGKFRVARWRLDEALLSRGDTSLISTQGSTDEPTTHGSVVRRETRASCLLNAERQHQVFWQRGSRAIMNSPVNQETDLLADKLLHLVHYNVFRGFFANKKMLSQTTLHFAPQTRNIEVIDLMARFPEPAVMVSKSSTMPPCLAPTKLQMNVPHATWIDLIPFPHIRDALILQHDNFDHADFIDDVIGQLLDHSMFLRNKIHARPYESDLTNSRNGLVLWGEPHDPDSWEATPGFLRKWAWAASGCAELMLSTDRWRWLRGEPSVQYETTLCVG